MLVMSAFFCIFNCDCPFKKIYHHQAIPVMLVPFLYVLVIDLNHILCCSIYSGLRSGNAVCKRDSVRT